MRENKQREQVAKRMKIPIFYQAAAKKCCFASHSRQSQVAPPLMEPVFLFCFYASQPFRLFFFSSDSSDQAVRVTVMGG